MNPATQADDDMRAERAQHYVFLGFLAFVAVCLFSFAFFIALALHAPGV